MTARKPKRNTNTNPSPNPPPPWFPSCRLSHQLFMAALNDQTAARQDQLVMADWLEENGNQHEATAWRWYAAMRRTPEVECVLEDQSLNVPEANRRITYCFTQTAIEDGWETYKKNPNYLPGPVLIVMRDTSLAMMIVIAITHLAGLSKSGTLPLTIEMDSPPISEGRE